jgi:hypothetical protein
MNEKFKYITNESILQLFIAVYPNYSNAKGNNGIDTVVCTNINQ